MKKLEKLSINSKKILDNNELKNLKGGECYICHVIYDAGFSDTGYACDCGSATDCEKAIWNSSPAIFSVACE